MTSVNPKLTKTILLERSIPARSKLEAVTRISALTGSTPQTLGPGSKERKSVLTDLAAGLNLEVNHALPKPQLGGAICQALGTEWTPDCWSAGDTVTLEGLNRILGSAEIRINSLRTPSQVPSEFQSARSKLEAVTRLSLLSAGRAQVLGPGSKERKSVLVDVATGLGLKVDIEKSKPILAQSIAQELGGFWDSTCWSAGQTITLEGLNRILWLVSEELHSRGIRTSTKTFDSVQEEARALAGVLASSVPGHLDGRESIKTMFEAESANWAQDEWRGWFFEFIGLPALINTFGGGPTRISNTTFDYSLTEIWDLKCHGDDSHFAILNSQAAIDECLKSRGIGLLVLSGQTEIDSGEFREWQREFRITNGRSPRARSRPASFQRRSKSGFSPRRIDAYFVRDIADLEAQVENRVISVMAQGRQPDGSLRDKKYVLNTKRADGTSIHIASLDVSG